MKISTRILMAVLSLAVLTGLGGCGTLSSLLGGKKVDYRKSGKLPPLEVPPDLTQPSVDDRFAVPAVGSATYSAYSRERGQPGSPGQSGVLPSVEEARVERSGLQRWLVVKDPPEKVWPVVRQFWVDSGYELKTENSQAGVLETEWLEGRPRIQETGIRGLLQRALGTVYSTSMRDKFRTRLERSADGGTEVYVSHRGMEEVYESEGKDRTVWQPRPSDPGQEAEMLQKLLVQFGAGEQKAKSLVATEETVTRARLTVGGEGASQLIVADPFDRAWRRVGLALDRVGFTVEDRDRSKGTYFVRYIDPQGESSPKAQRGLLSKMMFWRSDSKVADDKAQYRIRVSESGGESKVEVTNASGATEKSQTANRILTLLFEQLK